MIDALVKQVFKDADDAHREHLLTRSYAQHMALGDFYEGAREKVDAITEAYIALGMDLPSDPAGSPLKQLEDSYVKLESMKEDICKEICTLENLYDELTAVYLSAIYKLKRLS
jgi:DNA-binding ferritin-like protein